MSLWLAEPVHAVAIDEDIVFLDTAADAYFCLVGARASLTVGEEGAVLAKDHAIAKTLLDAGLLQTSAGTRRKAILGKPTRDLDLLGPDPRASDLAALVQACAATALAFRLKSFRRLLADVRRGRRTRSTADPGAVLDASSRFSRMRPWSPVGGACLMRSYLQLQYLHRLGLDADWVIGVRTWPFMAHCWLQVGAVALDDDVERLIPYTPILVV